MKERITSTQKTTSLFLSFLQRLNARYYVLHSDSNTEFKQKRDGTNTPSNKCINRSAASEFGKIPSVHCAAPGYAKR